MDQFGPSADLLTCAAEAAQSARGLGEALDHPGADPRPLINILQRSGLLVAALPAREGGLDLGLMPHRSSLLAEVLMTIGRGSLPMGRLFEGHVNALDLIHRFGDGEQMRRASADVREGCLFGVWATDDPSRPLRMTAEGRLEGRKILASGAGRLLRPLVTAATEAGVRLIAPRLRPGERSEVGSWTASGMQVSATGSVDFTGMVVGEADRIGPPGCYQKEPYFTGGAWRFLAVQCGGVEELVQLMRHHLRRLDRDGDPHQRRRLGECMVAAETARLWVRKAALVYGSAEEETVLAYVQLSRHAVERAALDVLERVQRSIGLQAFLRPSPVERVARDLATYLRQPGPDRALDNAAALAFAAEQAGWP